MRVNGTPFRTSHFPFLFILMDTPFMFEVAFKLLWGDMFSHISGQQLIDGIDYQAKQAILDLALQVTVGDKIKVLSYDR